MIDPRPSLTANISLNKSRLKPFDGFIFLCGGETDATKPLPISLRDAIYRDLAATTSIGDRVRLAEDFKDWSHDGIYKDLVEFEKHLADLSSVIVLVLESPGSLTELGLFVSDEKIRKKLQVFIATNHYKQTSFIKLGPIDYLEKTHANMAECDAWQKEDNGRWHFDNNTANTIQKDLGEAVRKRLEMPREEEAFTPDNWLHRTLLVCDVINLMSALPIGELKETLRLLGIDIKTSELRQMIYVLERVSILTMEPIGDQRFYLSIDPRQFLKFHLVDKLFDLARFRSDVLAYYSLKDKKRFRAIQRVRKAK